MTTKPPVILRRYVLPSIVGEGWAIIVLGSDGYFSAVSDFGNYAFLWTHHGHPDFRTFVIRIASDPDYVCGKLSRKIHDDEATMRHIRQHVLDARRQMRMTKAEAREEWDLLDEIEDDGGMSIHGFHEWYGRTKIGDASEMTCDRYPGDVTAFAEKALPRLADVLRAEMAAEAAPVGVRHVCNDCNGDVRADGRCDCPEAA